MDNRNILKIVAPCPPRMDSNKRTYTIIKAWDSHIGGFYILMGEFTEKKHEQSALKEYADDNGIDFDELIIGKADIINA
jgi:hypothetical protein